jgi:hypothetical protein
MLTSSRAKVGRQVRANAFLTARFLNRFLRRYQAWAGPSRRPWDDLVRHAQLVECLCHRNAMMRARAAGTRQGRKPARFTVEPDAMQRPWVTDDALPLGRTGNEGRFYATPHKADNEANGAPVTVVSKRVARLLASCCIDRPSSRLG